MLTVTEQLRSPLVGVFMSGNHSGDVPQILLLSLGEDLNRGRSEGLTLEGPPGPAPPLPPHPTTFQPVPCSA